MNLKDILDERIIDLELAGSNKDEVLRNLSKCLLDEKYINNVDQFVSDIYIRETEGPTGMGFGISIPHGKSSAVEKNTIAIGKLAKPVEWESSMSDSGIQQTSLVFLFCVSDDAEFASNHMLLLAELAGKLGNDARIAKLLTVTSKKELIDTLVSDEITGEGITTEEEELIDLDIF